MPRATPMTAEGTTYISVWIAAWMKIGSVVTFSQLSSPTNEPNWPGAADRPVTVSSREYTTG